MRILSTILFLLIGFTAPATTYYVDYAAGDDANAGTSNATAWQHCPDDAEYTGSGSLSAGDTVIFKGGVSYVFTYPDDIGFTPTSGVTYDGNSAGTWGAGKAILTDDNNPIGHNAFQSDVAVSNIVIRNFTITQLGGSASLPTDTGSAVSPNWGAGVNLNGGAQNITIQDCDMSKLGYWFNQQPMDANSLDGAGVFCFPSASQGYSNILITNCSFQKVRVGCSFSAGSTNRNITLADCSFSDSIVWCVDLNVRTTNVRWEGVTIKNCDFFDYYQFNEAYWTGYGGFPHTDGIFFRVDYNGATFGTNNNFYGNRFYSTTNNGGGTAQIYVTEGPSCNIYNNLFIGAGLANGSIEIGDGPLDGSNNQLVRIFNNTFYDSYDFDVTINNVNALTHPIGQVWMANNLFYDAMTGSGNNWIAVLDTGSIGWNWAVTNWFINQNLYLSFNYTSNYVYSPTAGSWGEGNIADMQLYGWESNGIAADPLFVDITPGLANANSLANDLHLQTNSPAISAGTNLTALAAYLPGLDKDFDGISRPASGAWDIGAYTYTVGTGEKPPANAPSNLRVIGGIYAGRVN